MKNNLKKLYCEVVRILEKDYDHENPWAYKISPAICRALKKYIKAEIKYNGDHWHIVNECKGYGFYSCFIESKEVPNKTVYVNMDFDNNSSGISRLFNSTSRILYRTANNSKDYKGGSNRYTDLHHIVEEVINLLEGKECWY